ncbi:MAG TPA: EAL domain-containing protein [Acetobacteraceae bacterium]
MLNVPTRRPHRSETGIPPAMDGPPSRFRLLPDGRAEAAQRRRLRRDLVTAAENDGFLLQYQPRVSLADGQTTGAEALVLWPHRKRGIVPPASFLPLAEEAGLTSDIGGWVLRAACREAAAWPQSWSVSVNVTPRQIEEHVLLRQLAEALELSGLHPERLELELSESMLVDVGLDTLLALSSIRDLGVGIALDDFGASHASLAMLKRLPLTALKIDRSLIRDLPADREDAAIVRAAIETGHALALSVVAEGIETETQRGFLSACGCDAGQGHLFSHAVPPEQLPRRSRV